MRFYEQIWDNRVVISHQIEPGAKRVMQDIDAACWLDAKQRLGHGLSTTQQWLLDKFFEDRERALSRTL